MPVFKASETIQLILIPPCYRITESLGVATYVEIPTTIRENILQIEAISVADEADALLVAISSSSTLQSHMAQMSMDDKYGEESAFIVLKPNTDDHSVTHRCIIDSGATSHKCRV